MFQHFQSIKFSDLDNLSTILELVVNSLNDEDLPVRAEAASSLSSLLEIEETRDIISPHLENIIKSYLDIMNESVTDVSVLALQTLVLKFKEETAPYMSSIMSNLMVTMQEAWGAALDGEDDACFTVTHVFCCCL